MDRSRARVVASLGVIALLSCCARVPNDGYTGNNTPVNQPTPTATQPGPQMTPRGSPALSLLLVDLGTLPEGLYLATASSVAVSVLTMDGARVGFLVVGFFGSPSLSPDRSTLAYIDDGSNLCLYDLESGDARSMEPFDRSYSTISWSPDGSRLAVATTVEGGLLPGLRIVNRTDLSHVDIDPIGAGLVAQAWSPDGRWIAFVSYPDYHLYMMDTGCIAEPSTCRSATHAIVVDNPELVFDRISWAPDSEHIVAECAGSLPSSGFEPGLCIVDMTTGAWTLLIADGTPPDDPAWSPLGDVIVYERTGAYRDILAVGVDGTGEVRIARDVGRIAFWILID